MQKFYYRLLATAFLVGILINSMSFFTGFNPRQLINISFFKERATAEIYLIKHIIFDSGIYIRHTDTTKLSEIIKNAAEKYSVDEGLLNSLVDTKNEFLISITGNMGISGICPHYFGSSGFSDPFNSEQNVYSTAETLRTLIDTGTPRNELISSFILCGKNKKIERIYPNIFENAINFQKVSANAAVR